MRKKILLVLLVFLTGICVPVAVYSITDTETPTITETTTDTITPTVTDTNTETITPTTTETVTDTTTPTVSETRTETTTQTATGTATESVTDTVTLTVTETQTETGTPTATETVTESFTQTATATMTLTVTETETQTVTGTVTLTNTDTVTQTITQTITHTTEDTETDTQTITPTHTETSTLTVTQTITGTATQSVTATSTDSITQTVSATVTGTITQTSTATITPSSTESETVTITPTSTYSATLTLTATVTETATAVTGEGTASITPATVITSGTGITAIIDYYAGSTAFSSGGYIKVTIPAGWSAPSITSGQPGYYTVSVSNGSFSGTSRSGQVITVFCNSLTPGTGRIRITYGAGAPGATAQPLPGTAYFNISSAPLGGAATDLVIQPYINVVAPSPTVTATVTATITRTITMTSTETPTATVTNTPLTGEGSAAILPSSGVISGTANTYTITYTAGATQWAVSPGYGTFKLFIPTGFSPPSETVTAPGYFTYTLSSGSVSGYLVTGQEIRLFVQGLNPGGTITVIYGSKVSGGPGAVNAGSSGNYNFRIETSVSGTLTNNIASHPSIILSAPTATVTVTVTMTATVTMTYTNTPNATIVPVVPASTPVVSGNMTTFSWGNNVNADYYRIYYATGSSGKKNNFPAGWQLIATVMPTPGSVTYTHTDALDAAYGYYIVTGVNGAGESSASGIVTKARTGFDFIPGEKNTYRISLPYDGRYTNALSVINAIEGNTLNANKIDTIALWNPYSQAFSPYSFRFGAWGIGTNFDIDAGSLSANAIYIHAVSSFDLRQAVCDTPPQAMFFRYDAARANANKRMLPYSSAYIKASDIVRDIEGSLGPGTNTKISKLASYNPATQSYLVFAYSAASGWILGTDFSINPGDIVNIYPSGNTAEFYWTPKLALTPIP